MIETNREFRLFWLERALKNLNALKGQTVNEEDTKRLIIEPLLAWIGYDVWEPGYVREQYPVPKKGGQSADYALMKLGDDTPYAIVEAKSLTRNPHEDLDQIIEYCNFTGARFGIITNGERWILLDEHWKGKPARDRIVFEVKIEDDLDKRKGYEALLLLNPENERILDDFCDSIKKLCESGIKNLEKHKITELVDALEKIETPTSEEKPRVPAESKETEVVAGEWPQNLEILIGKSPPGSILIGNEKYQIRSWRDILLSTAEWLIRKGHITEPFKLKGSRKLYVVNSEPKQPDSKDKRMGKSLFIRLSNGLYLWAKLNSADCVLWSFYLLEHFGYTPGHAYLKPPADWKS